MDTNVVESSHAQPMAKMFGQYLHQDVAAMAAAYLFHFAVNQGFQDGNKRTAANCALMFLYRNGYELQCSEDELVEVTQKVAIHAMEKSDVADWIASRLAPNQ